MPPSGPSPVRALPSMAPAGSRLQPAALGLSLSAFSNGFCTASVATSYKHPDTRRPDPGEHRAVRLLQGPALSKMLFPVPMDHRQFIAVSPSHSTSMLSRGRDRLCHLLREMEAEPFP